MRKLFILTILAFFLAGFVSAVQAQEPIQRGACKADVEKFCKDVKKGGGRIIKCMRQHEKELSQACKDEIAAAREKEKEFQRSCRADEAKFCKDVRPGGGRIIRCLKQHEAELSPACQAYFKK